MNGCICEANQTLVGFDWLALSNDIMGFVMLLLGVLMALVLVVAIAGIVWTVARSILEFVHSCRGK